MAEEHRAHIAHDRELVQSIIDQWKHTPNETRLPTLLANALKAHPDWAPVTQARLKKVLKQFNLLPQTPDQLMDLARRQDYSRHIVSASQKMPGLAEATPILEGTVKIISTKARGNGLYAVKAIEKGQRLWSERPIVVAPSRLRKADSGVLLVPECAHCQGMVVASSAVKCPECTALFCDKVCLAAAPTVHRIIWRKTAGHDEWLSYAQVCEDEEWLAGYAYGKIALEALENKTLADQFASLAWIRQDQRVEIAGTGVEKSVFGEEQSERLWQDAHTKLANCLAAVSNGTYELTYDEFQRGLGAWNLNNVNGCLFMIHSHLNHSCEPNVKARFIKEGKRALGIEMVVLQKIGMNEELKVTYVDPEMGYYERQDLLRKNWGFVCVCPRCKREFKELLNK